MLALAAVPHVSRDQQDAVPWRVLANLPVAVATPLARRSHPPICKLCSLAQNLQVIKATTTVIMSQRYTTLLDQAFLAIRPSGICMHNLHLLVDSLPSSTVYSACTGHQEVWHYGICSMLMPTGLSAGVNLCKKTGVPGHCSCVFFTPWISKQWLASLPQWLLWLLS